MPDFNFTLDEIKIFFNLVLSRHFEHKDDTFLAPVLDMINFSLTPNIKWERKTNGIFVYASQDISNGEQIFLEMPKMSNMDLLTTYGFVIENNPNEEKNLLIDAQLNPEDPYLDEK